MRVRLALLVAAWVGGSALLGALLGRWLAQVTRDLAVGQQRSTEVLGATVGTLVSTLERQLVVPDIENSTDPLSQEGLLTMLRRARETGIPITDVLAALNGSYLVDEFVDPSPDLDQPWDHLPAATMAPGRLRTFNDPLDTGSEIAPGSEPWAPTVEDGDMPREPLPEVERLSDGGVVFGVGQNPMADIELGIPDVEFDPR